MPVKITGRPQSGVCVTQKVSDEVNCRDICVNTHVTILGRGRSAVCVCVCVCMPVEKADFFNEEQKLCYISSTVRDSSYSKNGKKV